MARNERTLRSYKHTLWPERQAAFHVGISTEICAAAFLIAQTSAFRPTPAKSPGQNDCRYPIRRDPGGAPRDFPPHPSRFKKEADQAKPLRYIRDRLVIKCVSWVAAPIRLTSLAVSIARSAATSTPRDVPCLLTAAATAPPATTAKPAASITVLKRL